MKTSQTALQITSTALLLASAWLASVTASALPAPVRATEAAPTFSVPVYQLDELNLDAKQISADFGHDGDLGRAWVRISVTGSELQTEFFSREIGRPVEGLSFRAAGREVLYTYGGREIVCARGGVPTSNCKLRVQRTRIADSPHVEVMLDVIP